MRNKISCFTFCHTLWHTIFILPIVLTAVPPCFSVCPEPRPKPNAEYFHSDVVFTGTVLSASRVVRKLVDGEEEVSEIYYRVHLQRLFRGRVSEVLHVYTSVDSVGNYLDNGQAYLLFAYKFPGHRTLRIASCGNSAPLEKADDVIRQLEEIPRARNYGEIEGELRGFHPDPSDTKLRIIVRGSSRLFVGRVDSLGQFHLRVPPGRYSLHVQSERYSATPRMFSSDNPKDFFVCRGGLAQMAFDLDQK